MITESHKAGNRKWDKENMRSVSCRLRINDAIDFKRYCEKKGSNPAAVLKEFVFQCIKKMYEEEEKQENEIDLDEWE